MRLAPGEIDKIAVLVEQGIASAGLSLRGDESAIRADIVRVIAQNMADEETLERDAEAMMKKFQGEVSKGKIDGHQMFTLIKRQLAKERKFVL